MTVQNLLIELGTEELPPKSREYREAYTENGRMIARKSASTVWRALAW